MLHTLNVFSINYSDITLVQVKCTYIYICIDAVTLKNFDLFQVSYEIGKTLVDAFKVIMKLCYMIEAMISDQ